MSKRIKKEDRLHCDRCGRVANRFLDIKVTKLEWAMRKGSSIVTKPIEYGNGPRISRYLCRKCSIHVVRSAFEAIEPVSGKEK